MSVNDHRRMNVERGVRRAYLGGYDDSFSDVCEICGATAEEEAEAKAGYLKGASSGMVRLAFVRQASPCSTVSHSFVLQCSWNELLSVGGSRIAESNRKRCGVPNRIS